MARHPRLLAVPCAAAILLSASACMTQRLAGDLERFDPMARLPEMSEHAGDGAQLQLMSLKGVRPDGRIDLTDRQVDGSAQYIFVRPSEPPRDAPPVGAGGSIDGRWQRRVLVLAERRGSHVTRRGGPEGTHFRRSRGLLVSPFEVEAGRVDATQPPPHCDLSAIFQEAIRQGAPGENVVARVTYSAGDEGSEPSYVLHIPGTEVRLVFTASCELHPASERLQRLRMESTR
ncbi:MAG: hypothetical protein EA397_12260 [Deltaproteobacteria bacterium]|nr:MAG: hypothetical protein EA397_12260 [Deltaproteobacteria bacterium]